jgi:hypothetical protein
MGGNLPQSFGTAPNSSTCRVSPCRWPGTTGAGRRPLGYWRLRVVGEKSRLHSSYVKRMSRKKLLSGWLSRYSTHKFTGAPPKLPPRMTRLVFTWTNSVPSRNNRCKLDHSGRGDTGRRKHIGGFLLGNFHKGMNHHGIELRAATLYQTSPGVFM